MAYTSTEHGHWSLVKNCQSTQSPSPNPQNIKIVEQENAVGADRRNWSFSSISPHLLPETQSCSHRSSSSSNRKRRGHGSIQRHCHSHPGNLRLGPTLIPDMPLGMSGSRKFSCLFGEVRRQGTECSRRAYRKCGESKRGRVLSVSALFFRTSGRCGWSTLSWGPWARKSSRPPQPL